MKHEAHLVDAIDRIGPDIYRVVLDGATAPMRYRAGQFLSLALPDGNLRSYSMAQPWTPAGRLELHVRLRPGGRMAAWLPTLNKGDAVGVHGPFGDGVRHHDDADQLLMLATGTGVAPLHAILKTVLAAHDAMPVTLYWGARTLDEIYMLDELRQLARQTPRFTFVPVLSRPDAAWAGARGHVQDVAARHHPDLRRSCVYACGSGAMVDDAKTRLTRECGLHADRFFADAFEPAELARDSDAPAVRVSVTLPDGAGRAVRIATGQTLYHGLRSGQLIDGVCGGRLACGTCRIEPAPAWAGRLPPMSEAEQRLLASLDGAAAGTRLACQIPVTPALEGLALDVPFRLRRQAATTQSAIEGVGPRYDAASMLALRAQTFAAIRAIAAQIRPGMTEPEALALAQATLASRGLLQGWHGIYVRFGRNTVKSWSEASEPGVVLGEDDIYFIDIGPTWRGLEGDGAVTFVTGKDEGMRRCRQDAHAIFDEVRRHWLDTGASGKALYDVARAAAERRGWRLNLELSGHCLGDFPHAAHFEGTMADIGFTPSAQLWVLEIHIRHPRLAYGAYVEDLLLPAQPDDRADESPFAH